MKSQKRSEAVYGIDYLVGGVLYCSKQCVKEAGKKLYDARPLRPEEYKQAEYGACCPVCEGEYANF